MTITSEPIVIVGIIDKADDLDGAAERAASEGLENTLYDETIVAEVETCLPEPIPVDPGRIPSVSTQRLSDTPTLMHEFKDRLSDHCLADEALETYALTSCATRASSSWLKPTPVALTAPQKFCETHAHQE